MQRAIAYGSPYIPPEWIAAFGFLPHRIVPPRGITTGREGVCPWAAALSVELSRADVAGVITVSTCDQLRRQAECINDANVMMMHVPATWQGDAPRQLYRSELQRVGQFMIRLGGNWPDDATLVAQMRRYDAERSLRRGQPTGQGVAITLVGGPLCSDDAWLLTMVNELGGRIALDATETGERGLPAAYEDSMADPLDAIVHAYFDAIPDAFRRPDSQLHDYLRREIRGRGVCGLVLLRYPWCDQWHAQLGRLKETMPIPAIEIDLSGGDDASRARVATRLETLIRIAR